MFGSLGFPELIFIFLLALLIFGPKKLPELGRTLGKAMAEFRKATTDLKRTINAELIEQELRDADPRKMVRDSLREAKASLENAVRQDDVKAAAAATATATAAAAAKVASAGAPAEPPPAADGSAAEPPAAPADEPDPTEPPPKKEPPGAVARGAAFEDPDGEAAEGAAPEGAAPAAEDPLDAAREPNAPQPATSS